MITKVGFSQNGIQNMQNGSNRSNNKGISRQKAQYSPSFKSIVTTGPTQWIEALKTLLPEALGDMFKIKTLKELVSENSLANFGYDVSNSVDYTNIIKPLFQNLSNVKPEHILYIDHIATSPITSKDWFNGAIRNETDAVARIKLMHTGIQQEKIIGNILDNAEPGALKKAESNELEGNINDWTWTKKAQNVVAEIKEALELYQTTTTKISDESINLGEMLLNVFRNRV